MRFLRCYQISAGFLLLTVPAFAAAPKSTTLRTHHHHASLKRASATSKKSGHSTAIAMPTERATEIQMALIKQGYLTGEPTGTWDAQTVSAMEKLQADNGWQSKITPDSRALIKLGLGPGSEAEQSHEEAPVSPR
jgi:peptidoglycan hydrolase-like protein with peptidoglycan-binding domain